jgi:hypothetical protein
MREDKLKIKKTLIHGERNVLKGGISCDRGANDEEPIRVRDDSITFWRKKKCQCQFNFLFFEEE